MFWDDRISAPLPRGRIIRVQEQKKQVEKKSTAAERLSKVVEWRRATAAEEDADQARTTEMLR